MIDLCWETVTACIICAWLALLFLARKKCGPHFTTFAPLLVILATLVLASPVSQLRILSSPLSPCQPPSWCCFLFDDFTDGFWCPLFCSCLQYSPHRLVENCWCACLSSHWMQSHPCVVLFVWIQGLAPNRYRGGGQDYWSGTFYWSQAWVMVTLVGKLTPALASSRDGS